VLFTKISESSVEVHVRVTPSFAVPTMPPLLVFIMYCDLATYGDRGDE